MALDELAEQNEGMFMDERDFKRLEAQKRKDKHRGLCERCRSLRFKNKPLNED